MIQSRESYTQALADTDYTDFNDYYYACDYYKKNYARGFDAGSTYYTVAIYLSGDAHNYRCRKLFRKYSDAAAYISRLLTVSRSYEFADFWEMSATLHYSGNNSERVDEILCDDLSDMIDILRECVHTDTPFFPYIIREEVIPDTDDKNIIYRERKSYYGKQWEFIGLQDTQDISLIG